MRTSVWVAPVASVVVLFGSVGIADLTGNWVTSGRTAVVAGQQFGVEDLKGWMTLQQAADGLGVPVAALIELIGAPDGTLSPDSAFRDIESLVPGFELSTFRDQVREYLAGAAVSPAAPTAPSAAAGPTGAGDGSETGRPAVTGQMTLAAVAQTHGIDLAELVAACGLPADVDTRLALKDLREALPSFEIQQVRDAVAQLS